MKVTGVWCFGLVALFIAFACLVGPIGANNVEGLAVLALMGLWSMIKFVFFSIWAASIIYFIGWMFGLGFKS